MFMGVHQKHCGLWVKEKWLQSTGLYHVEFRRHKQRSEVFINYRSFIIDSFPERKEKAK